MAIRTCPECSAKFRTITQFERHMALHSSISVGEITDEPELSPEIEAALEAPSIEPLPENARI